jgi:hypothetical protein
VSPAFADFGQVADEMSAGMDWRSMVRGCDRQYRSAIAARVERAP